MSQAITLSSSLDKHRYYYHPQAAPFNLKATSPRISSPQTAATSLLAAGTKKEAAPMPINNNELDKLTFRLHEIAAAKRSKLDEEEEVTPEEVELMEAEEDDDYEDAVTFDILHVEKCVEPVEVNCESKATTAVDNLTIVSQPSKHQVYKFEPSDFSMDMEEIIDADGAQRIHCKKCDARFLTKELLWQHSRVAHMNPSRVLQCQYCAFVTELRHHYDFHLKSHTGEKPFQCDLCDYRCKNRGMLTSHRKSHQEGYDFFCADCNFRAKFKSNMHSHVRRTCHRQLEWPNRNAPRTPQTNTEMISTDVTSNCNSEAPNCNSMLTTQPHFSMSHLVSPDMTAMSMLTSANRLSSNSSLPHYTMSGVVPHKGFAPLPPPPPGLLMMHVDALSKPSLMRHNIHEPIATSLASVSSVACNNAVAAAAAAAEMSFFMRQLHSAVAPQNPPHPLVMHPWSLLPPNAVSGLNLGMHRSMAPPMVTMAPPLTTMVNSSSKGNSPAASSGHPENGSDANLGTRGEKCDSVQSPSNVMDDALHNECQHCRMIFQDEAMYDLHRGYHTHDNPFKCNRCGYQAENRLDFTLHLYKIEHK